MIAHTALRANRPVVVGDYATVNGHNVGVLAIRNGWARIMPDGISAMPYSVRTREVYHPFTPLAGCDYETVAGPCYFADSMDAFSLLKSATRRDNADAETIQAAEDCLARHRDADRWVTLLARHDYSPRYGMSLIAAEQHAPELAKAIEKNRKREAAKKARNNDDSPAYTPEEAAIVAEMVGAIIPTEHTGEQSPALTPEEQAFVDSLPPAPVMPPYLVLHNHQRRVRCSRCNDRVQTYTELKDGAFAHEPICLPCADTLTAPDDDDMPDAEEPANAYTLATRSPEGGVQTIIAVSHHDISAPLPTLVLHGGQPAMSGPWQAPSDAPYVPAIGGGSHEADTFTATTDAGEIIATGDFDAVHDIMHAHISGPLVQLTPGGHWQSAWVKRGVRVTMTHDQTGSRVASVSLPWQAEDTGTMHGPAFVPAPTLEPEAVAVKQARGRLTLAAVRDVAAELSDVIGKTVTVDRTNADREPSSTGAYYTIRVDGYVAGYPFSRLTRVCETLQKIARNHKQTVSQPEAPKPARKPRNVATSQKRDNQRAERAAINEAYHAHAEQHAPDVAAILADFGFTVISEKLSGDTPVTIWQSADATIKQTPYSLRIYNGQPARLPRHGDAELINRVDHGWCAAGDAHGYAAGLAAALLALLETPDPYMQALDDMEAATMAAPTLAECRRCDRHATLNDAGYCPKCAAEFDSYGPARFAEAMTSYAIDDDMPELPALVLHGGQPSMNGPWQAPGDAGYIPAISGGSQDAEPTAEQIAALKVPTADGNHLEADDPVCGYCVKCGQPATHMEQWPGGFYATCDTCKRQPECPHDAEPAPVVYSIEITSQDLDDAPYYTATATYHCRTQRGIEAQRRAVAKRAERAAATLDLPYDSIITIQCDDDAEDVRYYEYWELRQTKMQRDIADGKPGAQEAYDAYWFNRIHY